MASPDPRENHTASAQKLLLPADTNITCPKCKSRFDLEQGFARAALERFEHSTEGSLEALRKAERAEADKRAQQLASQQANVLHTENAELKRLLKQQGEKHAQALKEVTTLAQQSAAPQLQAMRAELAARQAQLDEFTRRESTLAEKERSVEARVAEAARQQAESLVAGDRVLFEGRLAEKDRQLGEVRSRELQLLKEKQALQDRASEVDIEVARKLDASRAELESRIRAQERERRELEGTELRKRLTDMQEQLAEAQRKGAPASQQLQGEVLELTLQEDLEAAFALDSIEEVRKGARGGDVIHRVMTRGGQVAGVLLWEAKRARDWSPQWVTKLKEDVRAAGADVGILVSVGPCYPREWEEGKLFDLHEEVWVTSWSTAVQLATALRSGLLEIHKQRVASAGKGEKMEAVYDYLTSSQFSNKLKAVYGAFHRMRQELEAEKSQTQQRWARREKQLQSGVAELVGVAGDIQGLAQQDLPLLEMEDAGAVDEKPGVDTRQIGLNIEG
ncbi:MAG: DUF2130 domain-containing protein [Gammaproteobacteria bacterium]|nr:DUF2130 domain-containing protein [Gammaproteobacteria bacterium]